MQDCVEMWDLAERYVDPFGLLQVDDNPEHRYSESELEYDIPAQKHQIRKGFSIGLTEWPTEAIKGYAITRRTNIRPAEVPCVV